MTIDLETLKADISKMEQKYLSTKDYTELEKLEKILTNESVSPPLKSALLNFFNDNQNKWKNELINIHGKNDVDRARISKLENRLLELEKSIDSLVHAGKKA